MQTKILVFLVEDEFLMREPLRAALQLAGFSVAVSVDADTALSLLDSQATKLDVLITDINLGPSKSNGWDVAIRARELQPELPVIYMTGASAHEWSTRGVPRSVLLPKPVTPKEVVAALAKLLQTTGGE